jgi:hypothetical protein
MKIISVNLMKIIASLSPVGVGLSANDAHPGIERRWS